MAKLEKVPFEEAMDLTGYGKFNLLTFILCSSIIIGMAFEIFSVSYLVPASACELGTTSSQQGLMAAMPLMGIIATSHIWGYLADTRGRKKVLCFSMTLSFVAGAASAFSPDWITFSILKLLSSGSVAGAFALSMTLLSECNPVAKRSAVLVLSGTVFLAANGLMAAIAIPVLPLKFAFYWSVLGIYFNSWRLQCLIFATPCAISAIGLVFAYESPKFLLSVGREDEALHILRSMFVINTKKSGEEYPVKSLALNEDDAPEAVKGFWSSLVAQTTPLFKPPLLKNTLLISIIFVIVYICINPYMVWMPYIVDGVMRSVQRGETGLTFCERLRASQNITVEQVEDKCALNEFAMTMVFGIGMIMAAGNTVVSILVSYMDRKTLLIIIQVICGVSGLLVNCTSMWYLSAVFFLLYISGSINFGFLNTFSVTLFPTYVKAMAVCLTLMVGRGSAALGINLLKEMLNTNCEASFYVFGSIALLGALLQCFLPGTKPKQRRCPET
ncbi:synaptic vesicle glycoprotein 2B-like isoform X2 [Ostrinia furnacalis]|uniref:synaptic vesicle glycoprotein 2B-like isoform X2 n=1 Tax=Ostrinia furnacalis TaxID=93504 RepID=UPI001040CE6F|nr:synaptic vesicle glycoprotein 2B-like isoform X2 [Ostrinia furnacalis]